MDASPPKRKRRRGLGVLAAVSGVVVLSYLMVVVFLGTPPTWWDTEKVCDQPSAINYGDGTYAVFVERPRSLSLSDPEWRAVISRDGAGSYGVRVALNPSTELHPKVTCRWTDDAVIILEPDGIEHRVPAAVFTGGR